jgi:NAD(P)-dependent dehydrogenase (short-subunit alcohol dehydrogenase family)
MSKVWLITGAGSGIGAGTAKAALQAGDRVVATGRNLDKVRHALRDVASENLLKLDATLVNVGAMEDLQSVSGRSLIFGRKSIAGSVVGGIAETQHVINYCAARNIKADIALIRPEDINRAYEQVVNKDVHYRFVIDLASMKSVAGSKS